MGEACISPPRREHLFVSVNTRLRACVQVKEEEEKNITLFSLFLFFRSLCIYLCDNNVLNDEIY